LRVREIIAAGAQREHPLFEPRERISQQSRKDRASTHLAGDHLDPEISEIECLHVSWHASAVIRIPTAGDSGVVKNRQRPTPSWARRQDGQPWLGMKAAAPQNSDTAICVLELWSG
jgi:hypothetical protein